MAPVLFRLVKFAGNLVDSSTGSGKRVEFRLVFAHAEMAHNIDSARVFGPGEVREQLDEEAGPHLITDRDALRTGGQLGDDGGGVLRLAPGQ